MISQLRLWCRRGTSRDAEALLRDTSNTLERHCLQRLDRARSCISLLPPGWKAQLKDDVSFIVAVSRARERLDASVSDGVEAVETATVPVLPYVVSELFLIECHHALTHEADDKERQYLITGPVTKDGTRVLSRIVPVKMAERSAAYVRLDEQDYHKRLIWLQENHGHQQLADVHSHISRGAEATKPSKTDIENQERLAELGCESIAGIFSLDGYVRFFSTRKDFELHVHGTTIETLSDDPRMKLLRLKLPEGAEDEA